MNQMLKVGMVAGLAVALFGCASTKEDFWSSQTRTSLEPMKFTPVYQVMQDKGLVKGEANEEFTWWGFVGTGPDSFSNEIGAFGLGNAMCEAAFYDACKKSGATILLAPRYSITKKRGIFWFSGTTKVEVEGIPAKLTNAEIVK